MAGIFPVDVGPQYEGEVIRKGDMYVEFGGPTIKSKFELVTLKDVGEVEDQKIEIIGPDIGEMQEGSHANFKEIGTFRNIKSLGSYFLELLIIK